MDLYIYFDVMTKMTITFENKAILQNDDRASYS